MAKVEAVDPTFWVKEAKRILFGTSITRVSIDKDYIYLSFTNLSFTNLSIIVIKASEVETCALFDGPHKLTLARTTKSAWANKVRESLGYLKVHDIRIRTVAEEDGSISEDVFLYFCPKEKELFNNNHLSKLVFYYPDGVTLYD